jgi:hypothetical protein
MTFEADLCAHLLADSGIHTLVGEHVTPMVRKEGLRELPAVTYHVVSATASTEMDNGDGGLINYRVQIDAWDDSYTDVVTLAELLRVRLQTSASSFSATLLPGSGGDAFEEQPRIYRRSMDFSCWYTAP